MVAMAQRGGREDYRFLFADNPQPMWVADGETLAFLEANRAAAALYGYSLEEFLQLCVRDLLSPEEAPRLGRLASAGGAASALTGLWRHRRADGSSIAVELRSCRGYFAGRQAVLVVVEDVAARRLPAETLRGSGPMDLSVIDSIKQVIFRTDARGRWTFLSAAWTEITGFTVEESLGVEFLRYVHPEDRQRHAETFQPLVQHKMDYLGHVARYLTKAGGYRWIEVAAQLASDPSGAIEGLFGTLTDITERKRAEEELVAARVRLQHLLVASPAVIYSCQPVEPHALTFVGENVARQLGYTAREVLDDAAFWTARLHPEDAPAVLASLAPGGRGARGDAWSGRYRLRHRNGTYRWIHDERRLVRDRDGTPVEIVGSWVDITDHRRAEDERARLSSVVEQSVNAILITGVDGTIEYVNPSCERLTGYARRELIGRTPRLFKSGAHDAAFYRALWAALAAGTAWAGRFVNKRKDGSLVEVEAVISPVRDAAGRVVSYVASMRDMTQQRRIEDQLRQAQKMEVAGRLAGGVAHDFNNILTVITGRAELLLQRLGPGDPSRRDVQLIQETAQRAASLARQLLAFSRKQVLAPRVLNLNAIVAGMEKMLRRLIGEDIDLVTDLDPALGLVRADPSQIEQVLMNLVVNARDAMPQGGGLTIRTANVDLDDAYARRHVDVRPGPFVLLSVTDTGCGMDPETQAHVFEPFFTTKAPDKGTGLGLSTVYGIVKQSGGHIALESQPGQGTTFTIYLPRVEAGMEPPEPDGPRGGLSRGWETVLLAEDDEDVRELAREALYACGYTVLEARNGPEALDVAGRHPGPIHLLVTDLVMPHLGGREVARRLARARPDMRVLYMSGYSGDVRIAEELMLIEKPFTPDSLALKVREVLDAPRRV
jgi:PAS domain S-box-containing protein